MRQYLIYGESGFAPLYATEIKNGEIPKAIEGDDVHAIVVEKSAYDQALAENKGLKEQLRSYEHETYTIKEMEAKLSAANEKHAEAVESLEGMLAWVADWSFTAAQVEMVKEIIQRLK